jgi:type I restriction enzyme S subunit
MVTVLKSPFIDNYINSVTYGVKMPRAGTDTMINLFIPLPPVKEQNRIIECIHSLNPLIQKYQKAEEQLYELNSSIKEQLKKSILQYAIEGKLVPQDPNDEPASVLLERIRKEKQKLIAEGKIKKDKNESIIYRRDNSYYEKQNRIEQCIDDEITFEIPDTWEWCRFNQLFKLTSGQDLSTDKFNSACKGIPYITGASNLENGSVIINRWTTEPKSFAYSGDLLLTCKGTIGKIAFLTVEKAHIARQIMSIASPYKINLHYIKLILNLNIINLKAKAKSMIPGISRDDVLSILIPVPPLNEQDRIVLKLQELKL